VVEAEGKGAVSLDGRLIDYASIRQAEVLVEKARQIAGGGINQLVHCHCNSTQFHPAGGSACGEGAANCGGGVD
jgi:hypothetical protein